MAKNKTKGVPNKTQNVVSHPSNNSAELPAEIAQRLAYADAIVGHERTADGQNVPISAAQMGHLVAERFGQVGFMWTKTFQDYRLAHAMGPVLAQMKQGLDEISCNYLDNHEMLLDFAVHTAACLVSKDVLWTPEDRKLLAHNQQMVAAGNPPFLKQVNLDWSSSYTNLYGMYDLPQAVLQRVNGKAVIDGGGFIGDTLTLFCNLFPQSVSYSFEPMAGAYEYLTNLLKEQIAQGKIKPFKLALGKEPGTLRLSRAHQGIDAAASTHIDYHNQELYEEAQVVTIDDFIAEHSLEVGLIKLDVEGAEPEIIQGALNTIKSQKPLLIIAWYHTPEEFYELKPYLESLNLGYKFKVRRSSLALPLTDTVLIAYQE